MRRSSRPPGSVSNQIIENLSRFFEDWLRCLADDIRFVHERATESVPEEFMKRSADGEEIINADGIEGLDEAVDGILRRHQGKKIARKR